MSRRTGHIPDPPDVVARRKGFHLLKAKRGIGAAPRPLSTNNRAWLDPSVGGPGVLDQSDTSSCEGHAHAAAITLEFAARGTPIPLVSPICLYTGARVISRGINADGTLPALVDEGTEPGLVVAWMQSEGACSAATWGDYPASSATINDEPTPQRLFATADFKLNGAYFLQSSGDQYILDLIDALAAKKIITTAIAASSSTFQNYSGGVLGPLDDAVDHASQIIDLLSWDGINASSAVFLGANTWSSGWGESGLYRFNADFARKYSSATAVLDLSTVGSEA
jgi:hypothetical protein